MNNIMLNKGFIRHQRSQVQSTLTGQRSVQPHKNAITKQLLNYCITSKRC